MIKIRRFLFLKIMLRKYRLLDIRLPISHDKMLGFVSRIISIAKSDRFFLHIHQQMLFASIQLIVGICIKYTQLTLKINISISHRLAMDQMSLSHLNA